VGARGVEVGVVGLRANWGEFGSIPMGPKAHSTSKCRGFWPKSPGPVYTFQVRHHEAQKSVARQSGEGCKEFRPWSEFNSRWVCYRLYHKKAEPDEGSAFVWGGKFLESPEVAFEADAEEDEH
jgi:hypothetical protein